MKRTYDHLRARESQVLQSGMLPKPLAYEQRWNYKQQDVKRPKALHLHINMSAVRPTTANCSTRRERPGYRSVRPLVDLLKLDQVDER